MMPEVTLRASREEATSKRSRQRGIWRLYSGTGTSSAMIAPLSKK